MRRKSGWISLRQHREPPLRRVGILSMHIIRVHSKAVNSIENILRNSVRRSPRPYGSTSEKRSGVARTRGDRGHPRLSFYQKVRQSAYKDIDGNRLSNTSRNF